MEELTIGNILAISPVEELTAIQPDIVVTSAPGLLVLKSSGFYEVETRNVISELLCGKPYEGRVTPRDSVQGLRNPSIAKLSSHIVNSGDSKELRSEETPLSQLIPEVASPDELLGLSTRRPLFLTYGCTIRQIYYDFSTVMLFRAEVAGLATINSWENSTVWITKI